MLAPRAVKRKACPPAIPHPPKANAAEKAAGDAAGCSADGSADSDPTHDHPALAAEANTAAESSTHTEQGGEEATDTHDNATDTHDTGRKNDEEEQGRARVLENLLVAVEEAVSDWGLSLQNQELLVKLQSSADEHVHASNLLQVRTIAALADSIADITSTLQAIPSSRIELDDSGFRIRRTRPLPTNLDNMTETEWGQRTFYIENIPLSTKAESPSRTSLIALLESLFGCAVEVLRLPELYAPVPAEPKHSASVMGQHVGSATMRKPDRKGKQRQAIPDDQNEYSLPAGDGPYKGFAFVVLADAVKAETAQRRWSWTSRVVEPPDDLDSSEAASLVDEEVESSAGEGDVGQSESTLDDQAAGSAVKSMSDPHTQPSSIMEPSTAPLISQATATETILEGDVTRDLAGGQQDAALAAGEGSDGSKKAVSPRIKADSCGFRMMPISVFNGLKYEYLSYSRDLILLQEKQETAESTSRADPRRGRSRSPDGNASRLESGFARAGRGHTAKRRRSPSPGRWEKKARSPSPDRWVRKALSPSPERAPRRYDANDVDYPRGCVVFLKRFNAAASTRTLKALLQAVLESEEVDVEKLQYVDHVRSVDSCHLRFSDAGTASFLASYFSGKGAKKLLHTDADSVDPREAFTKAPPEEARAVEAEVISGTPEIIYWSKVPLKARQAYSTNGTAAREEVSAVVKGTMEMDDDEEAYHRSLAAQRKRPAA